MKHEARLKAAGASSANVLFCKHKFDLYPSGSVIKKHREHSLHTGRKTECFVECETTGNIYPAWTNKTSKCCPCKC